GPHPESDLGKLRKHSTFGFRSNSSKESEVVNSGRLIGEEDVVRVTRSIKIVKSSQANQKYLPPISPLAPLLLYPLSQVQEGENHFDFAGGQHRLLTKRKMELDLGARLLILNF
ncbi:hypothetical protein PHJA_002096700, partial [Phtheirospermum japonicum]